MDLDNYLYNPFFFVDITMKKKQEDYFGELYVLSFIIGETDLNNLMNLCT